MVGIKVTTNDRRLDAYALEQPADRNRVIGTTHEKQDMARTRRRRGQLRRILNDAMRDHHETRHLGDQAERIRVSG